MSKKPVDLSYFRQSSVKQLSLLFSFLFLAIQLTGSCSLASDWDEDSPKTKKTKISQPQNEKGQSEQNKNEGEAREQSYRSGSGHPLEGKVEKAGEASLRIQRQGAGLKVLDPQADKTNPALDGKAVDDELRGILKDGSLNPMSPLSDALSPLQGKAVLLGGKGAAADPDADDSELLVEWDRWRNRFLRAVQLGTQEILNNPDPEDYERPRVDPNTGAITSRYPLGTGCAFSCLITEDGLIKNLETIEASGFPKYDRAVLRAVQQLAGTQILRFPKGSHRHNVVQPGRIKTSTSNAFQYHHFGDVEKIRH